MKTVLVWLDGTQRRRVEDMYRQTTNRVEALRCRIILLLAQGLGVGAVVERTGCVRATVYRTMYRWQDDGEAGLLDGRKTPGPRKVTAEHREKLSSYVGTNPRDFGWERSAWTLELFALQLEQETGTRLSVSTVRSVLRQGAVRYSRPRPALRIPVRGRRQRLEFLADLAARGHPGEEVFYADEADIDLNPRIGATWMRRGEQALVLTPGQNVKYYIAAALNARTGTVVWVHGPRKNSELFANLVHAVHGRYKKCRRIHLILDNYVIHKSRRTNDTLDRLNGRVQLQFLPPYSPEANPIERLWKQLHDNVTRNHRFPEMESLWQATQQFMYRVQPFPGTNIAQTQRAA
jgi:transposase